MGRGTYTCVKCLLVALNTLTTIVGLALIGLGVFVFIKSDDFELSEKHKMILSNIPNSGSITEIKVLLKWVAYGIFGIGSIISIISLVGCCGSMFKSRCPLITYAMLMLLLCGVKTFITIMLFTGHVNSFVEKEIVAKVLAPPTNEAFLHIIENQMECCGMYTSALYGEQPASCCPSKSVTMNAIGHYICPAEKAYDKGCFSKMDKYMNTFGYVLIGLVILEFLNMIAAIYLCFPPMKKQKYTKVEVQRSHGSQPHSYPATAPSAPYIH